MSQFPPSVPPSTQGGFTKPHRGVLILVLGILGIVICVICGIVAWVMGNSDMAEMRAGRMDPSGMGMTKAGKICGIVSVALWIFFVAVQILFMVLGVGAAAVSGGAGTP